MYDIRVRLGRNIACLRKQKGLTQVKLAELAAISPTFMMHIERGSRGASLETIEALSKAFDVDVSVLFSNSSDSAEQKVISVLSGKNEFEEAMVLRISQTVRECIASHYETIS